MSTTKWSNSLTFVLYLDNDNAQTNVFGDYDIWNRYNKGSKSLIGWNLWSKMCTRILNKNFLMLCSCLLTIDDNAKDGGPGEVWRLCSFYRAWIKTNCYKSAISGHTTLKLIEPALKSYLKITCAFSFISYQMKKLVQQKIVVKTTCSSDRPWSAIFSVIVYRSMGTCLVNDIQLSTASSLSQWMALLVTSSSSRKFYEFVHFTHAFVWVLIITQKMPKVRLSDQARSSIFIHQNQFLCKLWCTLDL